MYPECFSKPTISILIELLTLLSTVDINVNRHCRFQKMLSGLLPSAHGVGCFWIRFLSVAFLGKLVVYQNC